MHPLLQASYKVYILIELEIKTQLHVYIANKYMYIIQIILYMSCQLFS